MSLRRFCPRPTTFLIYIDDLWDDLSSNAKLFADDTFLFLVVHDINESAIELNRSDLKKINDWAFQWKITFNSDHSNQSQGIISSRKLKKAKNSTLLINNNIVSQVDSQIHIGVILNVKLTFNLKNVFNKTNKIIGLLRKLCNSLPLITIFLDLI